MKVICWHKIGCSSHKCKQQSWCRCFGVFSLNSIQLNSFVSLKGVLCGCLTLACVVSGNVLAHENHAHEQPSAEPLEKPATVGFSGIQSINVAVNRAEIVRPAPPALINPSIGGQWSNVTDWPLVAVHAALLPNGKVLAWDATPDDADDDPHTTDNYTTRVTLWDPLTDTHVQTNNDTDTDLFCAGSAHLWDGRILFAGGDGGRAGTNGPLANSNIYNPATNTWYRTSNMNAPRWYSSVAALSNGEMLTLGGSYTPNPLAEVFQFDQSWRALSGTAPIELTGDYQWLQQTPEGSVLSFGPSNLIMDIDTNDLGEFTPHSTRDNIEERDYGSYAMYDVGKILVAGGGEGLDSSVIIDTATRQTSDTTPMLFGRRQHNLTILADGSVLATGGNSDGTQYFSPTAGVFTPEIWYPQTGAWVEQNRIPTDRQYHSIALLLPSGEVLSAGGGICGICYELGYEERNAEIFSPPYLFNSDGSRAERPRLGLVPDAVAYGEQVFVSVESSSSIAKAHLIKLGSTTHSENQDQRLVPLAFNQSSRRLTLNMPDSRSVAPPGHYLLFAVNSDGVPSLGSMVKVGQPLIGSNQRVNATLEPDQWDSYQTEMAQRRVRIELDALPDTSMTVSSSPMVRQADSSNALCRTIVSATGKAVCEFDLSDPLSLFVSVTGSQRSDYTLAYVDNGAPSSSAGSNNENGGTESPSSGSDSGNSNADNSGNGTVSTQEAPDTNSDPVDQSNNMDNQSGTNTDSSDQSGDNPFTATGTVRTGVGFASIYVLLLLFGIAGVRVANRYRV